MVGSENPSRAGGPLRWLRARAPAGPDEAVRWWGLALYLAAMVLGLLVWAAAVVSMAPLFTWIFLGSAGVGATLLYALLTGRPLRTVSHLAMVAAIAITTLGVSITGGVVRANIAPFLIIVIAAVFLLGRKGLPYALGALAIAIAMEVSARLGVVFPDIVAPEHHRTEALVTWSVSAVLILLFAFAYDEARRRVLTRLEAADRSKTAFLAGLSHEIRNPLQIILGANVLLARTELDAEQREYADAARHAADGLIDFLGSVLSFASLERGLFRLDETRVRLHELVDEVGSVLRFSARQKHLELEVSVAEDVPHEVTADSARLRQILMNLGENAIKYTEAGSVRLSVARRPAGRLSFSVRDTGVGIAPDDQERIFEGFQRAATTDVEGTGLGLSITHRLVSLMGGRITLESTPGRGSEFTVVLPLRTAAPAPTPEEVQPSRRNGSSALRVLLVEDLKPNRDVTEAMLRLLGHEVIAAENGRVAVERFAESRPDLVLMDVRMPEMDGPTATRRIRELESARGLDPVVIVAMTGDAVPEQRDACLASGADRCLFKPYGLEQLSAALGEESRPDA